MKEARQLVHDAFKAALRRGSADPVPECAARDAKGSPVYAHTWACDELTEAVAFDRLLRKNERELGDYAAGLTRGEAVR